MNTVRKILVHVCVVCSLVSITAGILDWYNPYMNFTGHISGFQMLLYLVVIALGVTEGGKDFPGKNLMNISVKDGCIITPEDLS